MGQHYEASLPMLLLLAAINLQREAKDNTAATSRMCARLRKKLRECKQLKFAQICCVRLQTLLLAYPAFGQKS